MKYVLFVCTHNAGRSQMAQAFFERDAPADMRAESAGLEPAAQMHLAGGRSDARGRDRPLRSPSPRSSRVEMQFHADLGGDDGLR